jgi:hypothetical protein
MINKGANVFKMQIFNKKNAMIYIMQFGVG